MALALSDQYRLATSTDDFTGRVVSAINGAVVNALGSAPLVDPDAQASRMALVAVCIRDPTVYVVPFKYAIVATPSLTMVADLDDDAALQSLTNALFDVLALRLTPTVA